jgi:hypothetical protein
MIGSTNYGPYSNSRLDSALCPYRFARCYIVKDAPEEHSEAANRGSAVHLALECIINAELAGSPKPSHESLLDAAVRAHPVQLHETFVFIAQAIHAFAAEPLRVIIPDKVVGVEELLAVDRFYKPVEYDSPEAVIRGKADVLMIDGSVGTLIDHKTQMFVGDDDAESFQMALYALLVLCTYPYLTELRTIIHYAAPRLNFYSRPAMWKREDLEQFKIFVEQRIAMAETIVSDNAQACPGKYCQYCSVLVECPMAAKLNEGKLLKPGPIKDADTALEYAAAHVFMEEKRSTVQEHLNAYVRDIGPVPVGDSVVEIRTYGGRGYDKTHAVVECLKKHGLDPANFTKLDSKALSDLIESPNVKAELRMELEKLTSKKPTLKLGVYKQAKGAR